MVKYGQIFIYLFCSSLYVRRFENNKPKTLVVLIVVVSACNVWQGFTHFTVTFLSVFVTVSLFHFSLTFSTSHLFLYSVCLLSPPSFPLSNHCWFAVICCSLQWLVVIAGWLGSQCPVNVSTSEGAHTHTHTREHGSIWASYSHCRYWMEQQITALTDNYRLHSSRRMCTVAKIFQSSHFLLMLKVSDLLSRIFYAL